MSLNNKIELPKRSFIVQLWYKPSKAISKNNEILPDEFLDTVWIFHLLSGAHHSQGLVYYNSSNSRYPTYWISGECLFPLLIMLPPFLILISVIFLIANPLSENKSNMTFIVPELLF